MQREAFVARKRTTRSEATRHRITRAAADCFGEVGYDGASLDDIAKRVGVTKATLYYHFNSKEAVYAGALDHVLSGFRDRIGQQVEGAGTPREKLQRLIWVFLEDNASGSRRFMPLPRPGAVDADVHQMISERRRACESLVADVVAEGQARGDLRPIGDPVVLAGILLTGVGRVALRFDPAGEITLREMHQILCSLFLDGLSSSEAYGPASRPLSRQVP